MDENYQEVRYDLYCKNCKHFRLHEYEEPCNECLECPARLDSNIPERFEKK